MSLWEGEGKGFNQSSHLLGSLFNDFSGSFTKLSFFISQKVYFTLDSHP